MLTGQSRASCTTDSGVREHILDELRLANMSVRINLMGGIYVNQHAGFSAFHVAGGNPASNASFTITQPLLSAVLPAQGTAIA